MGPFVLSRVWRTLLQNALAEPSWGASILSSRSEGVVRDPGL